MQRRFYHSLQTIDGLVQHGKRDSITLEDLDGVRAPIGTAGSYAMPVLILNEYGQVVGATGLPPGATYYSFTVNADHSVTPSTTPPSGGVTRLVTVTATVGNVDDTEATLSNTTLAAGILGTNGDVIEGIFSGDYADNIGPSYVVRLYFGDTTTPTVFYTSDPKGVSGSAYQWTLRFTIIRVSSSVVRCNVTYTDDITVVDTHDSAYIELTGLTLSGATDIKLTGESDSAPTAANDITLTMGYVEKHAA